jgi:hypothetical protein
MTIDPLAMYEATKFLALGSWILLMLSLFVVSARPIVWPLAQWIVPAILSVCYILMVWGGREFLHLPHSFTELDGIGELYRHPGPLTAGWLHFLALDLFVGAWMVRDGLEQRLPRLLILLCLPFAFIFAPSGLLLYIVLRFTMRRKEAP